MPTVEFSNRDFLRGTIVPPSWYRVKIITVGEALAKNGGSTNYPVNAEIICNGDTGATTFVEAGKERPLAGVPIDWNFNSKAIGFALGYLQALGVDVKPNQRFDLGASEGHIVDVYVENDTYEGRLVNRVNHKYRAPRKDVSPVTTASV